MKGRLSRVLLSFRTIKLKLASGLEASRKKREEAALERNIWNLYLDIFWSGLAMAITGPFVAVFAIKLGATDTQIGLLTSLPALVLIISTLPAARIINKYRRLIPLSVKSLALVRFFYLPIVLMPFLIRSHRAEFFIICIVLMNFPAALANIAFTTMMGNVLPPESRSRVVGNRSIIMGTTQVGATPLAGKLLDILPFPLNYQLIYLVAFFTSMISLKYIRRIEVKDIPLPPPKIRRPITKQLKGFGRMISENRSFFYFCLSSLVLHWGLFIPAPLFPIYLVKYLGATNSWIGMLSIITSAAAILTYRRWTRLINKRGNYYILLLSTGGLVLYPFIIGFTYNLWPYIPNSIIAGVFSAGFNLAFFNALMDFCPEERRASFVAVYSMLMNTAAFLAPLVGTFLIGILQINLVFFIASGVRLIGVILFWRLLKPARSNQQVLEADK